MRRHPSPSDPEFRGFVRVRGAREHNLKDVSLEVPRDALVVFTGVSGSGKSSLAFGTLYAEAQRRYLESVAPYARRLFHQMGVPDVDEIEGLPPAVALQQQRGTPTTRSSVGSVTTLSNLLRMLYSRAGEYPPKQELLYAESFSPNTPEGACPECHGLGRLFDVTEELMVPDPALTIREKAVAAWPGAWQGQNLRDILTAMHIDIDVPWRELPKKTRDWILYTDETPTIPVYAHFTMDEVKRAQKRKEEPSYMGTFTGARRHVLQTFSNTQSAMMKRKVAQFMASTACRTCDGKRLRPESLSVKFDGLDIAEMSRVPLKRLGTIFHPYATGEAPALRRLEREHPEKAEVMRRISEDLCARLEVLLDLGLGYLALERSTPTLSPGELQRLRLATQVRSNLFGVVYVLDEPSAGLHPSDTEALLRALDKLKASGNSIFVVEHEIDVIRHADWVVDVGPNAGEHGGEILYSGPLEGLKEVKESKTAQALWGQTPIQAGKQSPRSDGPTKLGSDPEVLTLPTKSGSDPEVLAPATKSGSDPEVPVTATKSGSDPEVPVTATKSGAASDVPDDSRDRQRGASPGCVPKGWLQLRGITRNNLAGLDVDFPLGVFTSVSGVSGSGKSTLVSQVLVELVASALGQKLDGDEDDAPDLEQPVVETLGGRIAGGMERVKRLIRVDQRPIGRTPRSNLATYTGLFDHVRQIFASTKSARARRYDVGRFSFNVAKGRCEHCEGEGFVMVELLFLPSVYAPCPVCQGTRYNAKTLEIEYKGRNIAAVLGMTVDAAWEFFAEETAVRRPLEVLREVGLGYLRLGQPATELSGGEAQRIKLATELQRAGRGNSLYVLDEPTTGLHPADVEKLMVQLHGLVAAGNTVIVVEHDMRVVAGSDWVIDMGPGAGDEGGRVVVAGPPAKVARTRESCTARFLRSYLE